MDPPTLVRQIRDEIFAETKLTASAGKRSFGSSISSFVPARYIYLSLLSGLAANKMLSKVCSDMNKPNGQYYLPNDRDAILQFVKGLPTRKVRKSISLKKRGMNNTMSNRYLVLVELLNAYWKLWECATVVIYLYGPP